MNIFLRELKSNRKSLFIWAGSLIVFILMMMSEFSAYYNNPEMKDILDAMPENMMKAFSMDNANLTQVSGFVSVASVYFFILLTVHAALLGSNIISKEEKDKTCEFLFVMPISRKSVLFYKLLASFISMIFLNLVLYSSIIMSALNYEKIDDFYKFIVLVSVGTFLIQVVFYSLGFFLATFMKRFQKSSSYTLMLLFSLYILSIVLALNDKLSFLKYFTPFKYFEVQRILTDMKLELIYVMISALLSAILIVFSFILYPKRDFLT